MRRNIAENFNRVSRVHERYRRQTDRQTDARRHIANMSSRSLKIGHVTPSRRFLTYIFIFSLAAAARAGAGHPPPNPPTGWAHGVKRALAVPDLMQESSKTYFIFIAVV